MRVKKESFLAVCLLSTIATPSFAKVSADEAKKLGGPVLTEFGAERAGNADGSIPAYTGGMTAPPANYTAGSGFLADPFAGEKPLYSVDAKNVDQYANNLTAGTAALIKKYPSTYRVDVYPTHRTASYPAWVLKNTLKNAVTAELVGNVEGDGVEGAYGGIPFPIPQNGYEVMWNNTLKWQGVRTVAQNGGGIFVDAGGHRTLTNETTNDQFYPYYDPAKTSLPDSMMEKALETSTAPASQDGTADILEFPINYGNSDQLFYVYTVGQRRVRLAPEFKYDTPVAQAGGAYIYDEINLWSGRLDRFDFKIVGKKDIIIPYNEFKLNQPTVSEQALFTPHHLNPDYFRWEKHRVWVVEATLKPGKRHIYSRRRFYLDEDDWSIVASDAYDQAGQLYRVAFSNNFPVYDAKWPYIYSTTFIFVNISQGTYNFTSWAGGQYNSHFTSYDQAPPPAHYSPETMAGSGIR